MIKNRDMGELMSRDQDFVNKPRDKTPPNPPPPEEQALNPFCVASTANIEAEKIYTNLKSKDQFRLLEILPGAEDTILQCRLHICSLPANHNAYEALSYCWNADWYSHNWTKGPIEYPIIECNGFEMAIGLNLHLALCRLRRRDTSRVVWADAICINQDDAEERGQQVSLMGEIFRNAFGVLVWLGVDREYNGRELRDPREGRVATALSAICSVVETWAAETGRTDIKRPHYRIQGLDEDFYGDGTLSLESQGGYKSLALYYKRWFKRLWVVQEIALARQATVICDKGEISWQWIGLAAAIIRTNWNRIIVPRSTDRQVPVGVMNAYFMYRISRSQSYFEPLRFSFCELLTLTRQFGCQEERDKIFGLLGLTTTDGINVLITPDYTSSLEDIYRHVATVMRASTNPKGFLSHVHHVDIFDEDGSMDEEHYSWEHGLPPKKEPAGTIPEPSWYPRWHIRGPQALAPLDAHPSFAAGLSKSGWSTMSTKSTSLGVSGIILEEVQHKVWLGHDSFQRHGQGFGQRLRIRLGQEEDVSPTLEALLARTRHTRSSLEKLAMTLAAGKSWYGTPIADVDGMLADFAACLVDGRLFWALERDAFGSREGARSGSSQDDGAGVENPITLPDLEEMAKNGNGDLFMDAATTACVGRCLFSTDSGMRGIGPLGTRPGDMVCIIWGASVPFIIRRSEDKQGYLLVGECYVLDLMRGEPARDARNRETMIELV